ncbi:MAG: M23 family metallopeptidase [Chromatocurvus sp.]
MPLTPVMRLRELLLAIGTTLATVTAGAQCVDVHGDPAQGGMIWGKVQPQSRVTLDSETIDVLPDGHFVAGFGRDAGSRSLLVVEESGERCEQPLAIAAREYRIQRVEGVPQRTVTPPPEQLERIRRERALVAAAKRRRVERPEWLLQVDGGFDWPATGRISGVYGSQRFYNGTPGSPHYGVDVAVPTGTPVVAPAAGIVTLAEDDLFYSGGTVILDHGYQLSSSFLHMSRVLVSVGDELARGDIIGEVGATGRATGPHLDWRMSWRRERVDPQRLVPAMPTP